MYVSCELFINLYILFLGIAVQRHQIPPMYHQQSSLQSEEHQATLKSLQKQQKSHVPVPVPPPLQAARPPGHRQGHGQDQARPVPPAQHQGARAALRAPRKTEVAFPKTDIHNLSFIRKTVDLSPSVLETFPPDQVIQV